MGFSKIITILVFIVLLPMTTAQINIEEFPIDETSVLVFLDLNGKYEDEGDYFKAIVKVKNIGEINAIATKVSFKDIPDDWRITPNTDEVALGTIKPGEVKTTEFRITRGETDASIFVTASAQNAREVSSEIIPIPIHPIMIALFSVFSIVLFYLRKKNVI